MNWILLFELNWKMRHSSWRHNRIHSVRMDRVRPDGFEGSRRQWSGGWGERVGGAGREGVKTGLNSKWLESVVVPRAKCFLACT